jgi:hypothetical protein
MPICNTIKTITKGCDNNIGGIQTVFINDQSEVTAVTVDDAAWEVTAMTTTAPFVPFEFKRNTGMYTEDQANDLINGSSFVTATITLMFHRREAAKSRSIKILGEGQRDLAVIVLDANGKYWYFPTAQVTAVAEGSGTAKADGSKYSITMVAENETLAYEVDPTIIAGLLV